MPSLDLVSSSLSTINNITLSPFDVHKTKEQALHNIDNLVALDNDLFNYQSSGVLAFLIKNLGSAFLTAFIASLSIIFFSELGDKTFFIAAVMSMKYSHVVIFSGAICALTFMTILSVAVGAVLPQIIDRKYTHYASIILFFIFGVRLLLDASKFQANSSAIEINEVEEELQLKSEKDTPIDIEAATITTAGLQRNNKNEKATMTFDGMDSIPEGETFEELGFSSHPKKKKEDTEQQSQSRAEEKNKIISSKYRHCRITHKKRQTFAWWLGSLIRRTFTPVFIQAFTFTMLAEWGDRSQIATIALAASKNATGVIIGAVTGHMICTGIAVVGGKILASRISEKTIAIAGGILFICFSIVGIILPY